MNNLIQNEAAMEEPKYEKFFGSTGGADTNEETNMPPNDQDRMLSMVVLLLTCLALAALAHVIV